jgi:hypothetical protein
MDTPDTQPELVQPVKKSNYLSLFVGIMGIGALVLLSYMGGKASVSGCTNSVLGVQSPNWVTSQVAMLFNLNTEKPANYQNNFQLAPTETPAVPEPTAEPTIEPNETPSMIWGGINRNPKPTETPAPNNKIITPGDKSSGMENNQTPVLTPTPEYKYNWNRNYSTPTPTPNNVIIEATIPTITPTPKPTMAPLSSQQVKQIIDTTGIIIAKPEITTNSETPGFTITGEIKDKLFGLLPVSYPVVIKMNEDSGKIDNVTIPWWRTLFGNPFAGGITKIRCGDGICSQTENYDSCKLDCAPVCGNAICEYGEGQDTCPVDCELFPTVEPTIGQ